MRHYLYTLGLFFFLIPVFGHAAALININTADAALLDTLPGIGASYAADIIAYRAAHGSFASIEDLQKVPNIGTGSRYTKIASLITVGDASSPSVQDTSVDTAASSTDPVAPPEATVVSTYVPPPSELSVQVRGGTLAILEVPVTFSAIVKTKSGATDSAARVLWSFGDGSSGEGSSVIKTYHYAGTYLVVATASDDTASARGEVTIVVKPSAARIALVSNEGITLSNDSDERLDLSSWRLTSSKGIFRIPVGTELLPHASVLFPFSVTGLPIAFDAALTYSSGVMAAEYAPPVAPTTTASPPAQPAVATISYTQVQEVEQISSAKGNATSHEKGINAPAATTELAAAGAAPAPSAPASPASGIFKSPWTLGLFGVMLTAAGAFILL